MSSSDKSLQRPDGRLRAALWPALRSRQRRRCARHRRRRCMSTPQLTPRIPRPTPASRISNIADPGREESTKKARAQLELARRFQPERADPLSSDNGSNLIFSAPVSKRGEMARLCTERGETGRAIFEGETHAVPVAHSL